MKNFLMSFGIYLLLTCTHYCSAMAMQSDINDINYQKGDLIRSLHAMGCISFGEFDLKSGQKSPIYIDLRPVISYSDIFRSLRDELCDKVNEFGPLFNKLCGVPDAAVPLTTAMAIKWKCSLIMKRKAPKDHGTKKMIEGKFEKGDQVLVVEDVITTGSSVLEVVKALRNEELKVTDVAVCLDREQKGKENLEKEGCRVHALFTITEIINELHKIGSISDKQYDIVKQYLGAQS